MKRYFVTPLARRDLRAIWKYLAKNASTHIADRVLADIYDAIQMLAEQPGFGHACADVTDPDLRFWPVHRYVIAYQIGLTPFTFVRVVHGARDFLKLFR